MDYSAIVSQEQNARMQEILKKMEHEALKRRLAQGSSPTTLIPLQKPPPTPQEKAMEMEMEVESIPPTPLQPLPPPPTPFTPSKVSEPIMDLPTPSPAPSVPSSKRSSLKQSALPTHRGSTPVAYRTRGQTEKKITFAKGPAKGTRMQAALAKDTKLAELQQQYKEQREKYKQQMIEQNKDNPEFRKKYPKYFQNEKKSGKGHDDDHEDGQQKYNQALYDTELIEILASYEDFAGCVMRNEVGMLLDTMRARKKYRFGFIFNMSRNDEKGTHRVAVFIDLVDGKQVCYYNSFGEPCPPDIHKELQHFVDESNLPYLVKFKNNRVVNQTDRSKRCGYHCAEFLTTMFKGGSFNDATHYNESTRTTEKGAAEDEHKFRKFGYI